MSTQHFNFEDLNSGNMWIIDEAFAQRKPPHELDALSDLVCIGSLLSISDLINSDSVEHLLEFSFSETVEDKLVDTLNENFRPKPLHHAIVSHGFKPDFVYNILTKKIEGDYYAELQPKRSSKWISDLLSQY